MTKSLSQLIQDSIAKVNAMSPEEREEMFCQQRRSFVRAEAGFGSDRDEAAYAEALRNGDKEKLAELGTEAEARMKHADEIMNERGL